MSEEIVINTETNIVEKIEPYSVYTEGSPYLRHIVAECSVPLPDQTITKIIDRLKVTMKLYQGLGLSANQCGIDLRAFVMGVNDFVFACINPKIISKSADFENDKEGCLSFPGLFLNRKRSSSIQVEFLTETGELKQLEFSGLTARIFQHELDHLNGISFIDDAGKTSLMMARSKQKKLIKKFMRTQRVG